MREPFFARRLLLEGRHECLSSDVMTTTRVSGKLREIGELDRDITTKMGADRRVWLGDTTAPRLT